MSRLRPDAPRRRRSRAASAGKPRPAVAPTPAPATGRPPGRQSATGPSRSCSGCSPGPSSPRRAAGHRPAGPARRTVPQPRRRRSPQSAGAAGRRPGRPRTARSGALLRGLRPYSGSSSTSSASSCNCSPRGVREVTHTGSGPSTTSGAIARRRSRCPPAEAANSGGSDGAGGSAGPSWTASRTLDRSGRGRTGRRNFRRLADHARVELVRVERAQRALQGRSVIGRDDLPGDAFLSASSDPPAAAVITGRPAAWASTAAIPNSSTFGRTRARARA